MYTYVYIYIYTYNIDFDLGSPTLQKTGHADEVRPRLIPVSSSINLGSRNARSRAVGNARKKKTYKAQLSNQSLSAALLKQEVCGRLLRLPGRKDLQAVWTASIMRSGDDMPPIPVALNLGLHEHAPSIVLCAEEFYSHPGSEDKIRHPPWQAQTASTPN